MRLTLMLSIIMLSLTAFSQALVIDHTCTDLSFIPTVWIDSVKTNVDMHYAHTSHGGQLIAGLDTIMWTDPFYAYEAGWCSLPSTPGVFCIFDGQDIGDDYITPELYWETAEGMNNTRDVLDGHPSIRYTMWAWCGQPGYYSASQMNAYCESLAVIDAEYPGVTVIYMTGHAQYDGWDGWTRFNNNNIIRDYCAANSKPLFDFGDIDVWWFNPSSSEWEYNTYEYDGDDVPLEHPHYGIDEIAHTSWENCEHKGAAFWWMMARLEGWSGPVGIDEKRELPRVISISVVPNPFNSTCRISFDNGTPQGIEIFDISGRPVDKIRILPGMTSTIWQPPENLAGGVYFVKAENVSSSALAKIVLLK